MSRKRARENRRIKAWETRQGIREEMIGSRNRYGIKDPTPYEAVRTIVREQVFYRHSDPGTGAAV